ncbi:MAG: NAD(+) diphosphatase [Methanospirillaceae archaeon]|nr:NAD(+) diphosphatase [Methanospirillaceae archaeon]
MKHYPFYAVRPLLPVYPEPGNPSPTQKYWILAKGNAVIFRDASLPGTVLMKEPFPAGLTCGRSVYLGMKDNFLYYAAGVLADAGILMGWKQSPVRGLSGKVPDNEIALASYGLRILDADKSNTFCGRCGAITRPILIERAWICTACNHITYPRISPAIIVLVKKGEEILLSRSPSSPPGFFSLIAGFNEPGENLEQTVHREVGEEVGIAVKNLRYFGSEPWPFPDSLMVGFVADYAGEDIRVDNREIEEACWFARDTLPSYPQQASISQALIQAWIREEI